MAQINTKDFAIAFAGSIYDADNSARKTTISNKCNGLKSWKEDIEREIYHTILSPLEMNPTESIIEVLSEIIDNNILRTQNRIRRADEKLKSAQDEATIEFETEMKLELTQTLTVWKQVKFMFDTQKTRFTID